MAESEKPFACPSPGCNMSFINEDHLTVHKKKHEMILNLESSNKNHDFIDQTPTPTRFIKNCEELGLFQDLQNVNPFEETFRRAVESGKTGTSSVSDTDISDDTLHTPHIFPHIMDCQPANGQIIHAASAIDELSSTPVTTVIDVAKNDLLDSSQNDNNLSTEHVFQHTNKTTDFVLHEKRLKLDDGTFKTKDLNKQPSSQFLSINGEDVQLLLKTADGKLMQLTAIPINENVESRASVVASDREDFTTALSSNEKLSTMVIKTNPPLKCSKISNPPRLSLAKLKLKQALTKASNTVDQSREILTGNDKDEDMRATLSKENVGKNRSNVERNKKQEMRERNRASSMRCRAKRKEWIQQLQQTISCANEKNAALQLEIKNLHTEIARLKTLLLAHKDCPITKAMEKGNNILIGSKLINVNPDVMQVAPELAVNTQLPVIPSASPISTKKSGFTISSPPKNPIILQKPEIQMLEIQPVAGKKISPLVRIITSDDIAEKQNARKKPCIINSSRIIVNPSVKIVDKIVISSQVCETKNLSTNSAET